MRLTKEQFEQKYGNTGQPTSQQPIQSTQPQQSQEPQGPGGFAGGVSKVGNFLGMKEFGQGLGESLATGSKDYKRQAESESGLFEVTQKLMQRANKYEAGNPKREMMLKMAQANFSQLSDTQKDYLERLPTNKQFIGSAVQTALNVGTAGMGAGKATGQAALKAAGGQAVKNTFWKGAANLGKQSLKFGAVGAGYGGAESYKEGNDIYGIGRDALNSGLITAAMPVAFKGAGGILKGAKNLLKGLIKGLTGVVTNTSPEAVNLVLASKNAKVGMRGGSDFAKNLFNKIRGKSNKLVKKLNNEYGKKLEALNTATPDGIQVDLKTLGKDMVKIGDAHGVRPTVKGLNFSQAGKINTASEQKNVQKAYNLIRNWDDNSVKGINSLRQKIGDLANYQATNFEGKASSALIREWGGNLSNLINTASPELGALNANYGKRIALLNDVGNYMKASSKNPEKITTSLNKFKSLFNKENQDFIIQMFKDFERASGDDIVASMAGQEFGTMMPAVFEKGGARMATKLLGIVPKRLAGEGLNIAGKTGRGISNVNQGLFGPKTGGRSYDPMGNILKTLRK